MKVSMTRSIAKETTTKMTIRCEATFIGTGPTPEELAEAAPDANETWAHDALLGVLGVGTGVGGPELGALQSKS